MSVVGQSRHFGHRPTTSGLPLETDIVGGGRHVSKVPRTDINGETGGAFIVIARVRSFAMGLNRAVRSEIPGTL